MEIKEFIEKPQVKLAIKAISIPFFGFILLNMLFVSFAIVIRVILLLFPRDFAMTSGWGMPVITSILIVATLALSWFVLNSNKINDYFKSIYLQVPLALVYVALGISLNRWPAYVFGSCAIIFLGIMSYLIYKKKELDVFLQPHLFNCYYADRGLAGC